MAAEILIFCDIVQSREHIKHNHWGDLPQLIAQINTELSDYLLLPFKILAGDDFAAVAKDLRSAAIITLYLSEIISAYKIRTVIIEGEVQGMELGDFSLLSGAALTQSKVLFEQLHQKKHFGYYAAVSLQDQSLSDVVNGYLNLVLSHKMNWDAKQKQVFHLFKQGKKQAEIAQALDVSQQYVSKIYRKLYFELVSQQSDAMIDLINDWTDEKRSEKHVF